MRTRVALALVAVQFCALAYAATTCTSPTPTTGNPVVQEETAAVTALQNLVQQYLQAPCPDPATGSISACSNTAKDLTTLVDAAAATSVQLKYCAGFGTTAAGAAIQGNDKTWYTARAALWDQIQTLKQNNTKIFTSGYYVLPSNLIQALSLSSYVGPPSVATAVAVPDPTVALEAEDKRLRAEEAMCIRERSADCLSKLTAEYQSFFTAADEAVNQIPSVQPQAGQNWYSDYLRLRVMNQRYAPEPLATALASSPSSPFAFGLGDLTGNVSHVRVIAGVDVSAASSVDPAAKFLLDASMDLPLAVRGTTAPIDARFWLWGYARMSSIASPGAVSGLSTPATYVQGLTGSAPNAIVQSFEGTGGLEYRIHTFRNGWQRRPMLISAIVDGGMITPISSSQAAPPVYVASPQIQAFYLNQAKEQPSTINTENSDAIQENCPAPSSPSALPPSTPVCYIAQYPADRSRFFHNYSAGFRVKRYYFNETNESFIFPAMFDFTVGQNDYVTAGSLRRWVSHFGGTSPIAGFPGLYVYGYVDLELSKNPLPDQQFILQSAPSTITPTSSNVASIFVAQPDRDRYRFGAGYDLTTLIKKLAPAAK